MSELDVCTCGRARAAGVHAPGAINGHAFAELETIDLDARRAELQRLVAQLGGALDGLDWTPTVLRLMKQIELAAHIPERCSIVRTLRVSVPQVAAHFVLDVDPKAPK